MKILTHQQYDSILSSELSKVGLAHEYLTSEEVFPFYHYIFNIKDRKRVAFIRSESRAIIEGYRRDNIHRVGFLYYSGMHIFILNNSFEEKIRNFRSSLEKVLEEYVGFTSGPINVKEHF